MSVPKKRISKSRTRSRRAHHALSKPAMMKSPLAGDSGMIRPHYAHTFNGRTYSWKELKAMMGKKNAAPAKTAKPATKKPAAKKSAAKPAAKKTAKK